MGMQIYGKGRGALMHEQGINCEWIRNNKVKQGIIRKPRKEGERAKKDRLRRGKTN